MDCSWADHALLTDQTLTPFLTHELRTTICSSPNTEYLDALATAALHPSLTAAIFTYYEPLFPDICARWMVMESSSKKDSTKLLSAFSKILPFAPYLTIYAERAINSLRAQKENQTDGTSVLSWLLSQYHFDPGGTAEADQQDLLLTLLRLLQFDPSTFMKIISPPELQSLFGHKNRGIRYLAIHIFCLYFEAADALKQKLAYRYVGHGEIEGGWEGKVINYEFLTLWEEKYHSDMQRNLNKSRLRRLSQQARDVTRLINREHLSPCTAEVGGVLLPRIGSPPSSPSAMIRTPTTLSNAKLLAEALKSERPILITASSGSGKSSLIIDAARELGVDKSMLVLHLNEQTDAKSLIGMYVTGTVPGSFRWQPGVLSTAVKEGRFVLIEDLDRAPTDVLGLIMPLLSQRELMVPNQGEKIHAGYNFRLIATIRTMPRAGSGQSIATPVALGERFWRRIDIEMPALEEYQTIIASSFPLLRTFVPTILRVYDQVHSIWHNQTFIAGRGISIGRPVTPRDLLRWCQRLNYVFGSAGSQTGLELLPEETMFNVFAEAVNCFAGYQQTEVARHAIATVIGEEMHVSARQIDYFFYGHAPSLSITDSTFRIGRASLPRRRVARGLSDSRSSKMAHPFVATKQSLRLLERVGISVHLSEPVLLVGETGTGKTALVQQLAESLGYKLTTLNLSQQSESGDLLGSFKPVDAKNLVFRMKEDFDSIFESTFSLGKNRRYLDILAKCILREQWKRVLILWKESLDLVAGALNPQSPPVKFSRDQDGKHPSKRRKMGQPQRKDLKIRWEKFGKDVQSLEAYLSTGTKSPPFKFFEGSIVRAARNGEWVLLDEINLAPPDTLEGLAGLLADEPSGSRSILLSDAGEIEQIIAHPDFRIFGAMNPATDVGKRDLPFGIRSRFFEIYVESPDRDQDDLVLMVKAWLGELNNKDGRLAHDLTRLYLKVKELVKENRLVDSANHKPHFTLRTLTRTLSYVADISSLYGTRRALYEGFSMSFLTFLNKESEQLLLPLIEEHVFINEHSLRSILHQTPQPPRNDAQYVQFENYWMYKGNFAVEPQPEYVITPFVRRNLLNLIRAVSTRRFPVLIQGPTSSGKTSLIAYLANLTGNKFVRVNNHEHTDLQEYLGTYTSDSSGKLRFQEGVLVHALREGHWIVLDELNLAPTDVLEALNRLLDDNRELMIPETQEIVRPHPHFMLLATQNPPGLYGGRKFLSRAFRNRFIELHFDEIPEDELEIILQERTQIAPSHCAKIVAVYKDLSLVRQTDRLFEQRNSFITLRDLFRWALRKADNREQLAMNGYMLIGERIRNPEERLLVKDIIQRAFKVIIREQSMYDNFATPEARIAAGDILSHGIVWTKAMKRLYVLASQALVNNEPVLLVGETGCGKTSICQLLAAALGKELEFVNAHQNLETGDILGAQRPVRHRTVVQDQLIQDLGTVFSHHTHPPILEERDVEALLEAFRKLDDEQLSKIPPPLCARIRHNASMLQTLFEWNDGALIRAMKLGRVFLLDEISLADDSVLERLNSLLEPQRTILLTEKGAHESPITSKEGFQFLATMNPGGDFGKKELSPALRNRFTEIWVPPLSDFLDLLKIVEAKLSSTMRQFSQVIVLFAQWFCEHFNNAHTSSISIRDVLAWIDFTNSSELEDLYSRLLHGAALVFIDTLGANPAAMTLIPPDHIAREREKCLDYLGKLLNHDFNPIYFEAVEVSSINDSFSAGPFSLAKVGSPIYNTDFKFDAPTTKINTMRIIRAMQLRKPILVEGSPGVGKTTLIIALAQAIGKGLTRINLSEQTDLSDLFGTDVPLEGAGAGKFAWREGPFLQAMRKGGWVLLDEMNLASQSVLEGLNSCFDHRGKVYISELDQSFDRHPQFAVFATQNPHHQGGGRKGLPMSFVNRFSVVYADEFSTEDMMLICAETFPAYPRPDLRRLLAFADVLETKVRKQIFAAQGGPWEFNLRDITRWLELLTSQHFLTSSEAAGDFFELIVSHRFRTQVDKDKAFLLFHEKQSYALESRYISESLGSSFFQVGLGFLVRDPVAQPVRATAPRALFKRLSVVESLMVCVQKRWPCILVGPSGCGKSQLIRYLASIAGATVTEFFLNPDVDATDLIGSYEQADLWRHGRLLAEALEKCMKSRLLEQAASTSIPKEALIIVEHLQLPVSGQFFKLIHDDLLALDLVWPSSEVSSYLEQCKKLLCRLENADKTRFEWVDGVLVKALEQGAWLILRNANLSSSSVLDRLNSLLEPNGYLTITERGGALNEATVITPHKNFRVFLTMDPRQGELSRAMRNRSVEIFMNFHVPDDGSHISPQPWTIGNDSSRLRFHCLTQLCQNNQIPVLTDSLIEAGMMRLSWADLDMLGWWGTEVLSGLIILSDTNRNTFRIAVEKFLRLRSVRGLPNFVSLQDPSVFSTDRHESQEYTCAQSIDPLLQPHWLSASRAQLGFTNPHWVALAIDLLLSSFTMEHQLSASKHGLLSSDTSSLPHRKSSGLTTDFPLPKPVPEMIFRFLHDVRQLLFDWVLALSGHLDFDQQINISMQAIVLRWFSTFDLASSPTFDEAIFQVHIQMWKKLSASIKDTPAACHGFLEKIKAPLRLLESSQQLTTGLSMERLWIVFRPDTPKTLQQLDMLLRLERLAPRLSAVVWKTCQPLHKAVALRDSLNDAAKTILYDTVEDDTLITSLAEAISDMEKSSSHADGWSNPYFICQFEGLCQHYDLYRGEAVEFLRVSEYSLDPLVSFLADRSRSDSAIFSRTTLELGDESSSRSSHSFRILASLSAFSGYGLDNCRRFLALGCQFPCSLLKKIRNVVHVPLGQLDLLILEVQCLGSNVARSVETICRNQLDDMSASLLQLIQIVFDAHADLCSEAQLAWINESLKRIRYPSKSSPRAIDKAEFSRLGNAHLTQHFQIVAEVYLIPALCSLQVRLLMSEAISGTSKALVLFATGCLILYVPDLQFDPALTASVQIAMHEQRQRNLLIKLSACRKAEQSFTGQTDNPRCKILEQELKSLNRETFLPCIVRPPVSELDQLQTEFQNILTAVLTPLKDLLFVQELFSGTNNLQGAHSLLSNVSRVIHRISRYRAYEDMMGPTAGMLKCLDIGLTLLSYSKTKNAEASARLIRITEQTPLLGGVPRYLLTDLLRVVETTVSGPLDDWLRYLQWVAIVKDVQGLHSLGRRERSKLMTVFHMLYTKWKIQLEKDQNQYAKSSGLYRYRGEEETSDEVSQKELQELFPDYDDFKTEQEDLTISRSPHELGSEVARLHSAIFNDKEEVAAQLLRLLQNAVRQLGELAGSDLSIQDSADTTEKLMPGLLLSLHELRDGLATSTSTSTTGYNFYSDSNIAESRVLLELVRRIHRRFENLRSTWPEHATVHDVLATCVELLAFRYADPVAKLLQKAEKLHGYLHEWEVIASKEVSSGDLYIELTSLLVRWRRLELSSWSQFFKSEEDKCHDDAKSWWYMAYEIVIAIPVSLQESGEELGQHAAELLATLETFLSTTALGQFSARLQILSQLEQHASVISLDTGAMKQIHQALNNFVRFYSSFEPHIKETLAHERRILEKQVKEVILLASWKDTNINALRESARRSHVKLFKLVRQYRAILARPALDHFQQSPVAMPVVHVAHSSQENLTSLLYLNHDAMELCQRSVAGWTEKPRRLTNINSTVRKMEDISRIFQKTTVALEILDSFSSELASSVKDLRGQTPSSLSDENNLLVKHLKSRKRRLFADTLTGLRNMGISHNHGTGQLAAQASMAVILAKTTTVPNVIDPDSIEIDNYFHQLLLMMQKARQAKHSHSQELTTAEVTRSVGYLEGILKLLLAQRKLLVGALQQLSNLKQKCQTMCDLWAPNLYLLQPAVARSEQAFEGLKRVISWLPNILQSAARIINVHIELAGAESPGIVDFIISAKQRVEALVGDWESLPDLPDGITSTMQESVRRKAEDCLREIRYELDKWKETYPSLRHVLKQIEQWTEPTMSCSVMERAGSYGQDRQSVALHDLDLNISRCCDIILAGLQQASSEVANLSVSIDTPKWLVVSSERIMTVVKTLNAPRITRELDVSLKQLSHLQTDKKEDLHVASALFATALPVVRMYCTIYDQAVQEYMRLHKSTSRLAYILAQTFNHIASQGYCTPTEQPTTGDDAAGKMEDGTGLGEGQGMNDVSHDINDDEDLTNIAQEPDENRFDQQMDEEKDAVEMADEMDGRLDDASQENEGETDHSIDEDEESEVDEKADDVDDSNPTAVDEKLWNGEGDKADKEQKTDNSKGTALGDEQVATIDTAKSSKDREDEQEELNDEGAEENEEVSFNEPQKQDEHVREKETLDLPEDVNLDADNRSVGSKALESDGLDDISEFADQNEDITPDELHEEVPVQNTDVDHTSNPATPEGSSDMSDGQGSDVGKHDLDTLSNVAEEAEEDEEVTDRQKVDNAAAGDAENQVPSDMQGTGDNQGQEPLDPEESMEHNARREDGAPTVGMDRNTGPGSNVEDQKMQSGSNPREDAQGSQSDQVEDTPQSQAFKKIGDALETWHRRQKQIREASERLDGVQGQKNQGTEVTEFEHLKNEDDMADAQALGGATEDQALALDESMAIDTAAQDTNEYLPQDVEELPVDESEPMDTEEAVGSNQQVAEPQIEESRKPGAAIGQRHSVNDSEIHQDVMQTEEDLDDVDSHLSAIQITSAFFAHRSASDAHSLWTQYEAATRTLSYTLTEQLRLILNPTIASKMRGDFRSGKRLNIKRIIPYIASQYKRDKIWMRRSAATKRNYQIMLAVDDSKSMGENGAGELAFETLVMVTRSLTMLEVGRVCIVAFGEDIKVAHGFESEFSAAAGVTVFQHFGFRQTRTNVRLLLSQSLDLFRAARVNNALSASSSNNADLWQLQLIISDGICEDHESIRRLVRQAHEECIMIVFIIVDNIAQGKGKGGSILEMTQAKFEDDGNGGTKVRMQRYLDGFPFPYYLVVGDVKELPGILANALRQWFAEVVDSTA